jgi:hypothetical protein
VAVAAVVSTPVAALFPPTAATGTELTTRSTTSSRVVVRGVVPIVFEFERWNKRVPPSENGFPLTAQGSAMPATMEVRCTDGGCELDMFELHYTYDMPDDVTVDDFACPYCGTTAGLEEIEL